MKFEPLLVNGVLAKSEKNNLDQNEQHVQFDDIIYQLRQTHSYIKDISVDDIVGVINEACNAWSDRKNPIQKKYSSQGLNFLLYWFREKHLKHKLDIALRGHRYVLDDFQNINRSKNKLFATPRGIIVHWISGNIPMLGMLSLVQGLLTKNINIIKVSKHNKLILPEILYSLKSIKYINESGKEILGEKILKTLAVIYINSDDQHSHEILSKNANVRVAWGGKEAVETIIDLPKSYNADDVVLGPKTSFAVVGREYLNDEIKSKSIARKIAQDASVFEQQGCNSPHTVFVEQAAGISPKKFASILAKEMDNILTQLPSADLETGEAGGILSIRTKYDMFFDAFYPNGLDWTVLYSDEEGLATPCFNRTLFVRPIRDIMDTIKFCSHLTQSVGVAIGERRKYLFAKEAIRSGIDRCPNIGSMSLYEVPWDGMFMMDRFVKWAMV